MNNSMFLTICSLFYSILLVTIYFGKRRLKTIENSLFSGLAVTNLIGIIIEISCAFVASLAHQYPLLNEFVSKMYLVYLLTWITLFTLYVFMISHNKQKTKLTEKAYLSRILKYLLIFYIVGITLVFVLPINYYYASNNDVYLYSYGPSVNLIFVVSSIYITSWLVCMIKNYKKLKNRKYLPLFVFIIFGAIVMLIQKINPALLLITSLETFITILMYFTIENPDLKLLREIQQSKEYAEHANNEKAMFLFNMTQEIRNPVKNIEEKCSDVLLESDIDVIKEEIRDIKFAAKKLTGTINGILDVSELEKKTNIEIVNNKYNFTTLLKQIVSLSKNNLEEKDKNIELRTNFDNNIPNYLYGDSIRIKQVIMTIMNNAIKHTDKGFIEFNVNAVVKHDICRLLITIEDSGRGIEAGKLETLFYNSYDVNDGNINKMDDTKESLSVIRVLTSLIGGTVVVNSDLSRGSKFTVVLDQKIFVDEKDNTLRAIEKLPTNKKILIVDDEEDSLKHTLKMLNKYDVNVDSVMWGQECLEKIRRKEKYDLILLDEDMPKLSGIKTFEKLKMEDKFDTPVVLLIESKHNQYKERYLNNGFTDCIEKPIKKTQLNELLKEYLEIGK